MSCLTSSTVLKLLGLLMLLSSVGLMVATGINSQKVEASVSTSSNELPNNPQLPRSSDHISLGNDDNELFTFLQLTDLHISIFTDPKRIEQLWEFCNITLKAVSPQLVIVSGDLTDEKSHENSLVHVDRQFEKEWITYSKFHQHCLNVTGIKTWLDIRGNHDNFNVNGYNSSTSFYPKYGVQRESPGSYMVTINVENKLSKGGKTRALHPVGHLRLE